MSIITLTTDWGLRDHYAATLKGVLYSRMPDAKIIDISHQIALYDILQASFVLRNSFRDFPPGTIHLVTVDSQLELEMDYLAIKLEGHYFLGPDVGIFSMISEEAPEVIVRIEPDPDMPLSKLNFAAKHLLANAICHLAGGGSIMDLGETRNSIVEKQVLKPTIDGQMIRGSIMYVDVYGNVITNISKDFFMKNIYGKPFVIHLRKNEYDIYQISDFYNDVPQGEKLALFNSSDFLEIAINSGSATGLLNLKVNDSFKIEIGDNKNR